LKTDQNTHHRGQASHCKHSDAHRPHLPACLPILKTHLPALWWQTSVPAHQTLSFYPLQWRCCRLQLSVQWRRKASVGGAGAGRSEIGGAPSHASVSSALLSPTWAYFIAAWWPNRPTWNDYVTSIRIRAGVWGIWCCQRLVGSCKVLAMYYICMWVLFEYRPIPDTAWYH